MMGNCRMRTNTYRSTAKSPKQTNQMENKSSHADLITKKIPHKPARKGAPNWERMKPPACVIRNQFDHGCEHGRSHWTANLMIVVNSSKTRIHPLGVTNHHSSFSSRISHPNMAVGQNPGSLAVHIPEMTLWCFKLLTHTQSPTI